MPPLLLIAFVLAAVWIVSGLAAFYRDFYPAVRPRRRWWKEFFTRWADSLSGMAVWAVMGPFALKRSKFSHARDQPRLTTPH